MIATQTENALVDAKEAAAICGMSRAAWYKHLSAGRLPRPVKIGNLARWRRRELLKWIDAGCPTLQKWDMMHSELKAILSNFSKQERA